MDRSAEAMKTSTQASRSPPLLYLFRLKPLGDESLAQRIDTESQRFQGNGAQDRRIGSFSNNNGGHLRFLIDLEESLADVARDDRPTDRFEFLSDPPWANSQIAEYHRWDDAQGRPSVHKELDQLLAGWVLWIRHSHFDGKDAHRCLP